MFHEIQYCISLFVGGSVENSIIFNMVNKSISHISYSYILFGNLVKYFFHFSFNKLTLILFWLYVKENATNAVNKQ